MQGRKQRARPGLAGLALPGRPPTLITVIVTLSNDPAVAKLHKNRDTSTQHVPDRQIPQRNRQRPGPVHLKSYLLTHRDSVEHLEALTPQHAAPPLSRLKDGRQIPHRPIRKEGVGVLTLHNILMKEPGQFLTDSTTGNRLVITNRRLYEGVPLQTRHVHSLERGARSGTAFPHLLTTWAPHPPNSENAPPEDLPEGRSQCVLPGHS